MTFNPVRAAGSLAVPSLSDVDQSDQQSLDEFHSVEIIESPPCRGEFLTDPAAAVCLALHYFGAAQRAAQEDDARETWAQENWRPGMGKSLAPREIRHAWAAHRPWLHLVKDEHRAAAVAHLCELHQYREDLDRADEPVDVAPAAAQHRHRRLLLRTAGADRDPGGGAEPPPEQTTSINARSIPTLARPLAVAGGLR